MGFQTPPIKLSQYLQWAVSGRVQLPDFQRDFKWEDERIRQLLVTVLRGHPMGAVMLLATGNDQIRFMPRSIAGVDLAEGTEADWLLLDGQQRITSLTQALTRNGHVETMDARGSKLTRQYYLDIDVALEDEARIEEAVKSLPADGVVRSNFGRDVDFDVSTEDKEVAERHFPLRLLFDPLAASTWLVKLADAEAMSAFIARILTPASSYDIPAIQLDRTTSKSAVATVFEKVNTGGLPLNVFELLTSLFAGDADYNNEHGEYFRLKEDWEKTQERWRHAPVLSTVGSTDFLQAVTMLTTLKRNRTSTSERPPAVSAKREDVLRLTLQDYLEWRDPLREAFKWAATFLADRYVFAAKEVPYAKQLVPLAAIRVLLKERASLIGVSERIIQWYWCGILGELYGGAIETRFARDIEQVPDWAVDPNHHPVPRTIADAAFVESRLLSLRSRNAAAYKGIAALPTSSPSTSTRASPTSRSTNSTRSPSAPARTSWPSTSAASTCGSRPTSPTTAASRRSTTWCSRSSATPTRSRPRCRPPRWTPPSSRRSRLPTSPARRSTSTPTPRAASPTWASWPRRSPT